MEHHGHPSPTAQAHGPGPGYETRDVRPRVLLVFAILLVVVLIVVHLGLLGVYKLFEREREPEPPTHPPVNLYEQLRQTREDEEETLRSYGWVDRKAGVVRIPIERAIDLVASRGVPKGKGPMTPVEINSHHGTPVEAKTKTETKAEDPKK